MDNKATVVIVALAVALAISTTVNLLNATKEAAQFEPQISPLEPKVIKNFKGENWIETGLEITTGKYLLEYQQTLKINDESKTDSEDALQPNTKITRTQLTPMESGEYVIQYEYTASGKDNYGNPISFVKTEYYNMLVP